MPMQVWRRKVRVQREFFPKKKRKKSAMRVL